MGQPHRVGVVGLGVISSRYLDTLEGHRDLTITAVADLVPERADAVAARLPGCRALAVPDLLADDEVDTVLNLTIPAAHAEVALAGLAHGKNVYGEKPLAATFDDARAIMQARGDAWVAVLPTRCSARGSRRRER